MVNKVRKNGLKKAKKKRIATTLAEQSEIWYEFLNDLYSQLIKPEIQENKSRYNVANIEDWESIESDLPQGLHVTKDNFLNFFNALVKSKLIVNENSKELSLIRPTYQQLEELNEVIELTLKVNITLDEKSNTVYIKGHNVKCSDFVNQHGRLQHRAKYQKVIVFALNEVTFDRHLDFGNDEAQLFIIAPKWRVELETALESTNQLVRKKVIVTHATIYLDGEDGEPHSVTRLSKRKDRKGDDGAAGMGGTTAGHFFGIADSVKDLQDLVIDVNGGDGAPGQSGADGDDGYPPKWPKIEGTQVPDCKWDDRCGDPSDPRVVGYKKGMSNAGTNENFRCNLKTEPTYQTGIKWKQICTLLLYGVDGGLGYPGGDGGAAGQGGYHGNATFISLHSNTDIFTHQSNGSMGRPGIGGKGGKNGDFGGRYAYQWDWLWMLHMGSSVAGSWKYDLTYEHRVPLKGPDGRITAPDGRNGVGTDSMVLPDKPRDVFHQISRVINAFKSFARKNLKYNALKKPLRKFLDELNNNEEVNAFYRTNGLAEELWDMENEMIMQSISSTEAIDFFAENELRRYIDYVPFYESLMTRIEKYARNLGSNSSSLRHKKVLAYAYASAQARMYNMKNHSSRNLINNVKKFLNVISDRFEELRKSSDKFESAVMINKNRNEALEDYKINIDQKIKDANNYANTLRSEFASIEDEIDKEIKELVLFTQNLEDKAYKDIDKAKKFKDDLESVMRWKMVFGVIKIGCAAADLFGPVGTEVGKLVKTVTNTAEVFLDSETPVLDATVKLPDNIAAMKGVLESYKTQKISKLTDAFKEFKEKAKKDEAEWKEVLSTTNNIQEQLNDPNVEVEIIESAENKFKEALDKKEKEFEGKKKETNDKWDERINVVNYVKKCVDVGAEATRFIYDLKKQEKKIEDADKAIKTAEIKFDKLKEYEYKIYNDIKPSLRAIEAYVGKNSRELEGQSRVALIVSRWKVQKSLRDVKRRVTDFAGTHTVRTELARSMEKLEETMDAMISIYDYIDEYQDEISMVELLANLTSSKAGSLEDQELKEIEDRLKIALTSNLVMKQYRLAIEAFKQYAFPFADSYIKESTLPPELEYKKYVENIIKDAGERLKKLSFDVEFPIESGKLDEDDCIFIGPFNYGINGREAFYEWHNSMYGDTIAKLLSGDEVMLYANVMQSPQDLDAIKFNQLSLYFRPLEENISKEELYEDLSQFRVHMTHSGESYYRYNNTIYRMTTNKRPYNFHLQKDRNDEPVHEGSNVKDMKKGDFLLSPYTIWEVHLERLNETFTSNNHASNKSGFAILEKYKNKVDLHLEGKGWYVDRNSKCQRADVNKYYAPVDNPEFLDPENASMLTHRIKSKRHKREVTYATEDITEYVTNNAAPSKSSPLNGILEWLKDNSKTFISNTLTSLNFSYKTFEKLVFNDENKEFHDALDTDAYDHTTEFSDAEDIIMKLSDKVESNITPGAHSTEYVTFIPDTDNNSYKLQTPLLSEENVSAPIMSNIEGTGLLMLADLLCRSHTGEKYKQAASLCPMQERAVRIHELKERVFGAIADGESYFAEQFSM